VPRSLSRNATAGGAPADHAEQRPLGILGDAGNLDVRRREPPLPCDIGLWSHEMNITPTCLAFLKSLHTPEGRDSLNIYASNSHDMYFNLCRDNGLCTVPNAKGRVVLTARGFAALCRGLTPLTWRHWAFLNTCGGSAEGMRFQDIMNAPNSDQLLTWTCEGQSEGWLTGQIWNHHNVTGWEPDNQHALLTDAGNPVLRTHPRTFGASLFIFVIQALTLYRLCTGQYGPNWRARGLRWR
jgi:hypothetical protein